MDAFAICCGFAGINPGYFYHKLGINEFLAIYQIYKESWEKARLPVLALGGKLPLPWDNETPAGLKKYDKKTRLKLANQLTDIAKKQAQKKIKLQNGNGKRNIDRNKVNNRPPQLSGRFKKG